MNLEIVNQSPQSAWDAENAFYWFSHPTRISKLLAHFDLYSKILCVPGDVIEFGVYKASSLIRFATFRKILENDFSRKIVGFDAFGKFPQNSENTNTDSMFIERFETEGGHGLQLIEVERILKQKNFENIELVKGDVFETLPNWLLENPQTRISLLHLDMDVYAPTKFVLDEIWERIVPGGLLIFDDYNSVEGETLAADEFLKKRNLRLMKNPYYNIPSYLIKTI